VSAPEIAKKNRDGIRAFLIDIHYGVYDPATFLREHPDQVVIGAIVAVDFYQRTAVVNVPQQLNSRR
jgi:hypothetical protein